MAFVAILTCRQAPIGLTLPQYTSIDGYPHISIIVQFTQGAANEPPEDLCVIIAFDANGRMGTYRFDKLAKAQSQWPAEFRISRNTVQGSWYSGLYNISRYLGRYSVMWPV